MKKTYENSVRRFNRWNMNQDHLPSTSAQQGRDSKLGCKKIAQDFLSPHISLKSFFSLRG